MSDITNGNKSFALFGLYWQYALDTILTHVFVIAFLKAGFSTTAAALMSLDSLFKIIFSVPIANLIAHIPSFLRGRISIVLKFFLVVIWFFSISMLLHKMHSFVMFILYISFKIILLVDSSISSEFIFLLRKYFKVDITKTVAVQNILVRSSVAIAPAIALIILTSFYALIATFIVALFFFIYSIITFRNMFILSENPHPLKATPISLSNLLKNPYMRWGLMYQILGNLAFAGVSFILLKELKSNGHVFFNEITMLYSSFLVIQIIIYIFGDNAVLLENSKQIAYVVGLCGLSVFSAGFFHSEVVRLIFCVMIGFTYSFSLAGIQKVVTTKLDGSGYIRYVGWAQMAGRGCSFAVTIAFGYAMSVNIVARSLLMFCGIFGIVASGLLMLSQINTSPELDKFSLAKEP